MTTRAEKQAARELMKDRPDLSYTAALRWVRRETEIPALQVGRSTSAFGEPRPLMWSPTMDKLDLIYEDTPGSGPHLLGVYGHSPFDLSDILDRLVEVIPDHLRVFRLTAPEGLWMGGVTDLNNPVIQWAHGKGRESLEGNISDSDVIVADLAIWNAHLTYGWNADASDWPRLGAHGEGGGGYSFAEEYELMQFVLSCARPDQVVLCSALDSEFWVLREHSDNNDACDDQVNPLSLAETCDVIIRMGSDWEDIATSSALISRYGYPEEPWHAPDA